MVLQSTNIMQRDFAWLVIVVILGGNTLVLLSSEDAADPNLIDIEDLTCYLGEILVSNTSLSEGYECTEFDPHSINHAHPAPVLTVADIVDDDTSIVVTGNVNHLHPEEISVRADLGGGTPLVATQPNLNGEWSLTLQSLSLIHISEPTRPY